MHNKKMKLPTVAALTTTALFALYAPAEAATINNSTINTLNIAKDGATVSLEGQTTVQTLSNNGQSTTITATGNGVQVNKLILNKSTTLSADGNAFDNTAITVGANVNVALGGTATNLSTKLASEGASTQVLRVDANNLAEVAKAIQDIYGQMNPSGKAVLQGARQFLQEQDTNWWITKFNLQSYVTYANKQGVSADDAISVFNTVLKATYALDANSISQLKTDTNLNTAFTKLFPKTDVNQVYAYANDLELALKSKKNDLKTAYENKDKEQLKSLVRDAAITTLALHPTLFQALMGAGIDVDVLINMGTILNKQTFTYTDPNPNNTSPTASFYDANKAVIEAIASYSGLVSSGGGGGGASSTPTP